MFIPSAGCSQLTTFALPEVLLSPGTTCPVCNGQQTALFSSCPAVYSHELQSTFAAALTGHLQLVTTVLGGTKKKKDQKRFVSQVVRHSLKRQALWSPSAGLVKTRPEVTVHADPTSSARQLRTATVVVAQTTCNRLQCSVFCDSYSARQALKPLPPSAL